MAKTHGSVRMGPMSILVLVVVLCLAVMTVLSASTASATRASAQRQAAFTAETYLNEAAAQSLVAQVDDQLQKDGSTAALKKALPAAVKKSNAAYENCKIEAKLKGGKLSATFTSEHGRMLNIVLKVSSTGYSVEQWKTSAQWSNDNNDTLWTGNVDQTDTQGDAQ